MSLTFGARLQTTTTGTGNLTTSSVSGYVPITTTFPHTVQQRFEYTIVDSNYAPIEAGIGYMSASTTMVRETIIATYDGSTTYNDANPTAFSLASGTKYILCADNAGSHIHGVIHRDTGTYKYYSGDNFGLSTLDGTEAPGTNSLRASPFLFSSRKPILSVSINCSTGVASSNARIGIATVGSDGLPDVLLMDSGDISTATSGIKTYTLSTPFWLPPGWYYCYINTSSTQTLRRSINTSMHNAGPLQSNGAGGVATQLYKTYTYGALPATAPGGWTFSSGAAWQLSFAFS